MAREATKVAVAFCRPPVKPEVRRRGRVAARQQQRCRRAADSALTGACLPHATIPQMTKPVLEGLLQSAVALSGTALGVDDSDGRRMSSSSARVVCLCSAFPQPAHPSPKALC